MGLAVSQAAKSPLGLRGAVLAVILIVFGLFRLWWSRPKPHNLPIYKVTTPDVVSVLERAYKEVSRPGFQYDHSGKDVDSVYSTATERPLYAVSARHGNGSSPCFRDRDHSHTTRDRRFH